MAPPTIFKSIGFEHYKLTQGGGLLKLSIAIIFVKEGYQKIKNTGYLGIEGESKLHIFQTLSPLLLVRKNHSYHWS